MIKKTKPQKTIKGKCVIRCRYCNLTFNGTARLQHHICKAKKTKWRNRIGKNNKGSPSIRKVFR